MLAQAQSVSRSLLEQRRIFTNITWLLLLLLLLLLSLALLSGGRHVGAGPVCVPQPAGAAAHLHQRAGQVGDSGGALPCHQRLAERSAAEKVQGVWSQLSMAVGNKY
jgi:hypothetical protein